MLKPVFTLALSTTCLVVAAATAPARADCAAEIKGIVAEMTASGPYHVKTTTEANGTATSFEGNMVLPDSFDIGMPQGRMVMTKNGVWMQMEGQWKKMPDQMRSQMKSMIDQAQTMGVENMKNVECLGSQDYEGSSYTAYSYDSSGVFMGIESKSKVKLYVDGEKHPAWLIVDGEALGTKSRTVQHLTYDATLTIADPQ